MKKILSFIGILLMGAMTSVALISCGSDDKSFVDETGPADKSPYVTPEQKSYTSKLTLTRDVLDMFQVSVIRKANDQQQKWAFTERVKFQIPGQTLEASMATEEYTIPETKKVSVYAYFVPKDEWYNHLPKDRNVLYLGYTTDYGFTESKTNIYSCPVANVDKAYLQSIADMLNEEVTSR